jgi:replicative DNA helicase
MADAVGHGKIVLGAIIPGRMDLLDYAMKHLTEEHFVDPGQQRMFRLLDRFAAATNAVLPVKYLDDLVSKNRDHSSYVILRETYESLAVMTISDSDFNWSVQQLRELYAERLTDEALTQARELLHTGDPEDGVSRHEAARQHLQEAMVAIERGTLLAESPEGMLNEEGQDLLSDYMQRKDDRENGRTTAIRFGIDELDRVTGGMQPGELVMTAAYSGEGKSTLSVQAAWSAAVEQGKNVVFFSTETVREQIRRKIIARHSKLEKFGLPMGLNTRDLKNGTLSPEDEEKFGEVVSDFTGNEAYGRIYIVQVPRSATVSTLENRLRRIQQTLFHVDFVVMDYLALLVPERGRNSTREELSNIIKEAKKVATTFDNGRGIPFLSPWQVSRAAREDAERINMYTSRALSETAEATNSADIIVSLLAPLDNSERMASLTMQVLKHRDGETSQSLMVEVDYATSAFRSRGAGALATTEAAYLNL